MESPHKRGIWLWCGGESYPTFFASPWVMQKKLDMILPIRMQKQLDNCSSKNDNFL